MREFFIKLLFGKRDAIIIKLRSDLAKLKITKQKQIDETNAYWKKRLYNKIKPQNSDLAI